MGSLLLDSFAGDASSEIIDISADGINNDGRPVQQSRLRAIAKGYTINAIAIPAIIGGEKYDYTSYFADKGIGGPNAFVIKTLNGSPDRGAGRSPERRLMDITDHYELVNDGPLFDTLAEAMAAADDDPNRVWFVPLRRR